MTKEIQLSQGRIALIDDEDYERVSQFKWSVTRSTYNEYAFHTLRSIASRRSFLMHRFILDAPDGMDVDHINGDGLDNRRSNLRLCTHAENMKNQKLRKDSISGFKGVKKRFHKWEVQIKSGKKNLYLGSFNTPEEAARAYDAKARELHGKFARTNFED